MSQLPLTRPSRTIPVDLCSRLKALTTLITPYNFSSALLNSIIPTLSHINFVQSKLTGPPLTRPPTTRPCHRTCPSGASWPVGKPMGFLPSVPYEMDDQTSGRSAYEACRRMGCLDEDAVAQMNFPFLHPQASVVRQLFA